MKKSDSTTFVAIVVLVLLSCFSARAESLPEPTVEHTFCPKGYELHFPSNPIDATRCVEFVDKLDTFPRFYSAEEKAQSQLFEKAFMTYLKERK